MRKDQRGLTMVELIISVALMSIIMVAVFSFMNNTTRLYSSNNKNVTLQNEAQTILSQLDNFLLNADAGVFDYNGCTYIASKESLYVIKHDTTENELYVAAYFKDDGTLTSDYTDIDSSITSYNKINETYVDNAKAWTVNDSDFELFGEYVSDFTVTTYFDDGDNNYVTVDLYLEYPDSDKTYSASQNVFLRNRIMAKVTTSSTTTSSSTSTSGSGSSGGSSSETENPVMITAEYTGSTKYYGDYVSKDEIKVTAKYSDGSTAEISSDDWVCSNINQQLTTGTFLYTVTYGGCSTGFTVNPVGINSISAYYSGAIKYAGNSLTTDVVEIAVSFNDGYSFVTNNWTSDQLGDTLEEGETTVSVTYSGNTYDVTFTVYPSIDGYSITEVDLDTVSRYVNDSNYIIIDVSDMDYVQLSVTNVSAYNWVGYYFGNENTWYSVQRGSTDGDVFIFAEIPSGEQYLYVQVGSKSFKDVYLYKAPTS